MKCPAILRHREFAGKIPKLMPMKLNDCFVNAWNWNGKSNPNRLETPRHTRGVLAKSAAHVTSTSFGAVTDMDLML